MEALPDNDVKKRLVANVDELKRETQRPNPRWRSFLGKALVLLAIVADIKTVHPEIGNEILLTIETVIQTIVTGCQVTLNQNSPLWLDHGQRHWAVETKRIGLKIKNEEEESGDKNDST